MARVKVKLADNIARVIFIESDATNGARLGVNLFNSDGSVATPQDVLDFLDIDPSGSDGIRDHRLLRGLTLGDDHPQYTRKDTLTTRGDLYYRDATTVARLGLGTALQFLRSNGTDPAWQTVSPTITLGTDLSGNATLTDLGSVTLNATIVNNAVTDTKLRDSVGLSVIGRSANTTGDPADIVAASDTTLLRRSGTSIGFGAITAAYVSDFTEAAQDAVGTALTDSASVDFTYNDGANTITAAVIPGGVDHGGLAGLADDDHPQYPLAAGTETISGAWTFSTNFLIENANPRILIQETGLTAETGMWDFNFDAGAAEFRTRTDADGAGINIVKVLRPAGSTTPQRVYFGNQVLTDPAGLSAVAGNAANYSWIWTNANNSTRACRHLIPFDTLTGAGYNTVRYVGSISSPTQIVNTSLLGFYVLAGYNTDTGTIREQTAFIGRALEDWTSTAMGAALDLLSTANGTASVSTTIRCHGTQAQRLDGSAALPSSTYQNDTDTGRYRIGANNEGISTGGTLRWDIDTARIVTTLPQRGPDGTAAAPSYTFSGTTTKGMYSPGTNQVALSANSARQFEVGDGYSEQPTRPRRSGVISPAQLIGNTDNWNPTGLAAAGVIRASTDASRNLTGIVAGANGDELYLINAGTQPLVLVNDATSTAANRFLLASGSNTTLQTNGCAHLWYDGTSARWRQIGRTA